MSSLAGLHAIIDTLDNAILYAPSDPFEKNKVKAEIGGARKG